MAKKILEAVHQTAKNRETGVGRNCGQNTVSANIACPYREQPQGGGDVAQTTLRPAGRATACHTAG